MKIILNLIAFVILFYNYNYVRFIKSITLDIALGFILVLISIILIIVDYFKTREITKGTIITGIISLLMLYAYFYWWCVYYVFRDMNLP